MLDTIKPNSYTLDFVIQNVIEGHKRNTSRGTDGTNNRALTDTLYGSHYYDSRLKKYMACLRVDLLLKGNKTKIIPNV